MTEPLFGTCAVLCVIVALAGCDARVSGHTALVADVRKTGAGTEVNLRPSLDSIARNAVPVDTLHSDWSTRANNDFGHIADVAAWHNGRFAVLDRLNQTIVIFAANGTKLRQFGRKGKGPGEITDPLAIEALADGLIVWDGATTVFTHFDTLGSVVATATAPIEGDWRPNVRRSSTFRLEHPLSAPWEDVTRRLRVWSDSEFVHQIQLDERGVTRGDARLKAPPMQIVRYSPALHVRDTVWKTVAPPSLPLLGGNYAFQQPVYGARPLWTTGTGWWAQAPADSNHVDLRFDSGPGMRIRLHESNDRPSLKSLKRKYAEWYIAENVMRFSPPQHKNLIQSLSWWRRRKQTNELGRVIAFADRAPLITALFGRGQCLFITGFNEDDTPDGTARTLLVLDVRTLRPLAVYAGDIGHRIREVSEAHVFTTYRDADNVVQLERFALPAQLDCAS
ncbi:MAG: 6-bladed beta-propeller [Gemmatimonadota bacterium]